jgi:hypothetical protein
MVERFIGGTQLVQVEDVLRVNKKPRLEASPDFVSESQIQN